MPTKLYRIQELDDRAFDKAVDWNRDQLEEKFGDIIPDPGTVLAWVHDEDYWYDDMGTFIREGNK